MNDLCRVCPGYKKCKNTSGWFSYEDIRWCPSQCIWLILNLETMKIGIWPDPPEYLETDKVQTGIRSEGSYVKPCSIIAELEARLMKTGRDGDLLIAQVRGEQELNEYSKSALYFITGWRRKAMSFPNWLKQRKYRAKMTTKRCQGKEPKSGN